jgi:DHA2 family multidrug resistance protein
MGSIMNFILGILLFGTVFIFPLFAQISLGWTATQTGVFMIPGALCAAIAMPIVAKLMAKGVNPKVIIIGGVFFTFSFLMLLGQSSPDSNESNFYFPFVLRGFGMAFMMSPILALAVGNLKGKDMAQAVGLANMIRQLGGAFGIALINVYLTSVNAQVRGNMLGYLTQYDVVSSERFENLTRLFLGAGKTIDEAQTLALKMMDGMLFKQQAIVCYNQGFINIGFVILLCIPIVLLIRYSKKDKVVVQNDH